MQLWIVGMQREDGNAMWEFVGVFDNEAAAENACLDYRFFMAPARLNTITPEARTEWPGLIRPKPNTLPSS